MKMIILLVILILGLLGEASSKDYQVIRSLGCSNVKEAFWADVADWGGGTDRVAPHVIYMSNSDVEDAVNDLFHFVTVQVPKDFRISDRSELFDLLTRIEFGDRSSPLLDQTQDQLDSLFDELNLQSEKLTCGQSRLNQYYWKSQLD